MIWVGDFRNLLGVSRHSSHNIVEESEQVSCFLNLVYDVAYLARPLVLCCWLAFEDDSQLCHATLEPFYFLKMVISLHNVCLCFVQVRFSSFAVVSNRCVQPIIQVVLQLVYAVCLFVGESLSISFDNLFAIHVLHQGLLFSLSKLRNLVLQRLKYFGDLRYSLHNRQHLMTSLD